MMLIGFSSVRVEVSRQCFSLTGFGLLLELWILKGTHGCQNYKRSQILPSLPANKVARHGFMERGGSYETPRSETKGQVNAAPARSTLSAFYQHLRF